MLCKEIIARSETNIYKRNCTLHLTAKSGNLFKGFTCLVSRRNSEGDVHIAAAKGCCVTFCRRLQCWVQELHCDIAVVVSGTPCVCFNTSDSSEFKV
jgi:hypothetical protein